MSLGIVLVHGYTGSPDNLSPLFKILCEDFSTEEVKSICLPEHNDENIPSCDEKIFIESISSAVDEYIKEKRRIILIGHSTGGSIVLRYIEESSLCPHSVILVATPKKITTDYFSRWEVHTSGKEIPLTSIAGMVSLVNKAGRQQYMGDFPVLVVHGEDDKLVPSSEAALWIDDGFSGPARAVIIPSAGHDIFNESDNVLAIDVISRFLSDVIAAKTEEDPGKIRSLIKIEPLVSNFISNSPFSAKHLIECPSGQKVINENPRIEPVTNNEPVFANIEVTTQCNLSCKYCARTIHGKQNRHMCKYEFSKILDLLSHCYHVTIVGLGEPLLNPEIVEIVAEASSRKRKISLVTNGMNLDKSLSAELLNAGLDSIVFSIDAANQKLASVIRPGTNLDKIIENIKCFIEINKSNAHISMAAFSAISKHTVPYFWELVDLVSELDMEALMLTDLNFEENIDHTLWKNSDDKMYLDVRKAIGHAFSNKLPVLSVRGLEEFGISKRYRDFILLPPGQIWHRSTSRAYCFSPWQTIPVGVDGDITICDCQPKKQIGNLFKTPLSYIWNGEAMTDHRSQMLSCNPPYACQICPRF